MRLPPLALFWLCAAAVAAESPSGLYKCRGEGQPIYQDKPCPPGTELRNLADDPPAVSVIPFERRAGVPPPPPRVSRPAKPVAAKPEKRNAADPAERRHVREGMSEGEVLAKLGPPDMQAGKTGRRMRWTYLPAAGDAQTLTTIRFEDGRVASVERTTLR